MNSARSRLLVRASGLIPAWLAVLSAGVLAANAGRAAAPADNPAGVVPRYGRLQVKEGRLCSAAGVPVQLRGMSSNDLVQFPFPAGTVTSLVNGFGASVVRAAMYSDSFGTGYIHDPKIKQTVQLIVEEAWRNGIYVIVDWHVLQDGNPNRHRAQAREFFQDMARAYGKSGNVIYEICNEPNGPDATWPAIRAYAEFIIPAIRAIDPDGVIIVGTDTWSQGVRAAADAPLNFPNVMYALHFYAGTHRDELRRNADYALSRGLPIFVSEWGLTDYTGTGVLHLDEAEKWMAWMNAHQISWLNWSLTNADEGSAALKPAANMRGPWQETDFSPSGAWIRSMIRKE